MSQQSCHWCKKATSTPVLVGIIETGSGPGRFVYACASCKATYRIKPLSSPSTARTATAARVTRIPGTPLEGPPDEGSRRAPSAARTLERMSTAPEPAAPRDPASALVFDDPLSQPSADDTDAGWGERPAQGGAGDLARFLDEKPPHHL
jgi:hypothetical protein